MAQESNIKAEGSNGNLDLEQVMEWVRTWEKATSRWPTPESGNLDQVAGLPANENWKAINQALEIGTRGLPKGEHNRSLAEIAQTESDRRWYLKGRPGIDDGPAFPSDPMWYLKGQIHRTELEINLEKRLSEFRDKPEANKAFKPGS